MKCLITVIPTITNLNLFVLDVQECPNLKGKMIAQNRQVFENIDRLSSKFEEETNQNKGYLEKQKYVSQMLTNLFDLNTNYFEIRMKSYSKKFITSPSFPLNTVFYVMITKSKITHVMQCILDSKTHIGNKVIRVNKVLQDNLVKIGRYKESSSGDGVKDITFRSHDDTVSRNQGEITFNHIPLIRSVKEASNPLNYQLGYKHRYQIFEGALIQIGEGSGQINMIIKKLSENVFINDDLLSKLLELNSIRMKQKQYYFRQFYRSDRLNLNIKDLN